MIRVLVVDDSAFMRKALSMMLEEDDQIQVVDTARDGLEAIEKVRALRPDVVTLDVEMPRMDGLTALKQIMKEAPCPVIMISSLTREGAQATLEALDAGAVDFIPKQLSFVSLEIAQIKADLIAKVKAVAGTRRRRPVPAPPRAPQPSDAVPALLFRRARLLAIGISTGGPAALQRVIPLLPANLPVPVVVVQHMPPHFTRSLAQRLDQMSPLEVVEAEEGMDVHPGRVIIAAGGRHLTFREQGSRLVAATPETPATLHRPSVDVMFTSAAEVCRGRVLAVVMTGMGHDGLEGARRIRALGGQVVAQDEASCVVYGMPRAIVEAGLAHAVVPLDGLAPLLTRALTGADPSPRPPLAPSSAATS
ncbi:MAG: chemotaxis response regulator protein-glutamate methylesterase [Bacteroidetes bacterium]|nr:MAG: chemotaxis response regulator protein-glutamate methylesterase [Bacteroidota bacterium]